MTVAEPVCAALVVPPGCPRRWHGPCHRGHARCVRQARRWQAGQRAAMRRAETGARCPHPHKTAYENQAAAFSALRHLDARDKRQGLNPYHCPAGHYHLGRRMRNVAAVWRK